MIFWHNFFSIISFATIAKKIYWQIFANKIDPGHILNPSKSFLTTEHWVQIYSNQKEIKYISHSNIRASVETRPPKLHNLLRFSLPFRPWHFMGLPPFPLSFASFCDTRISSIGFLNVAARKSVRFDKKEKFLEKNKPEQVRKR